MNEKYIINDICDVGSSKRIYLSEYQDSGIPFYRGKEIIEKDSNKEISNELFISQERYNEIKEKFGVPKKGDILMTAVGTIGISWYVNEEDFYFKDGNLIWFKNFKKDIVNSRYLYYIFKSKIFSEIIKNISIGSTQKAITIEQVKKIELEFPKIEIQNKIVKILDNISNKIKLNNKINNNLLQLCRYKYDELNKKYDDWDLVKINDLNLEVTDYVANGSFKSLADNVTLYDDKEYALYVRNTDLKVNFTDKKKYVDQKSYEFLKKSKLKGGELIISNVGDVGSVFICPHLNMPMTLGSNVIMLYETDSHYYNYFLYFFFTSVYGQYMIGGITGGSAQPKFNKTDFRNMEIKFPAFDELDKFNAEIDPIYKKYELNIKENEKLSELRDTLLPKLINGEIDLDNIEI